MVAEDAREKLMDAAAELFAQKSNVSVRAIAKAAGVNHGLVHYYFGSKESLKREAFSHAVEKAAAELPLTPESTPEEIVDTVTPVYENGRTTMWMGMRSVLDREDTLIQNRGFPIFAKLIEVIAPDNPRVSVMTANAFLTNLSVSIIGRPYLEAATGQSADALKSFLRGRNIALIRRAREQA
jgi:AcrR family transcriptional regulator